MHFSIVLKRKLILIFFCSIFSSFHTWIGTIEMPKEDHGVLIISVAAVVSFLTCLLCTLCHRKRKRRHHRQLHRNAHYDSTTSATGNFSTLYATASLELSPCFSQVSTQAGAIYKVVYQEVFMASVPDHWEFHPRHQHQGRFSRLLSRKAWEIN